MELKNRTSPNVFKIREEIDGKIEEKIVEILRQKADGEDDTNSGTPLTKETMEQILNERAPLKHASAATTYGAASASNYGHAKASAATPLMNGTAAVGTDNGNFAREGHVHPSDTAKAPTSHASTATTYGAATASNYGHAKASSAAPIMNGIAAVGTDNGLFAREGHVHPSDSAKLAIPTGTTAQVLNGLGSPITITDSVETNSPISAMFFKIAHPVWDIIETTSNRNPGSYFQTTSSTADDCTGACGRWERYAKGEVLVGYKLNDTDFGLVDKYGGFKTHTLSVPELPPHRHIVSSIDSITGYSANAPAATIRNQSGSAAYDFSTFGFEGGGQSHNNLQPYRVVHIWRRIA